MKVCGEARGTSQPVPIWQLNKAREEVGLAVGVGEEVEVAPLVLRLKEIVAVAVAAVAVAVAVVDQYAKTRIIPLKYQLTWFLDSGYSP